MDIYLVPSSTGTPAQRLGRALSGRPFTPLDVAALPHYPGRATVNTATIEAMIEANPAGTARLLADLAHARAEDILPAGPNHPRGILPN